LRIRKMNN